MIVGQVAAGFVCRRHGAGAPRSRRDRTRIGVDVSSRIGILYAPPAAWSHGYLWGADVLQVPNGVPLTAKTTQPIAKPVVLGGGVESGAADYALEIDSATAVRTLNTLLKGGLTRSSRRPRSRRAAPASRRHGALRRHDGRRDRTDRTGRGLTLRRVATAPAQLEDIDRSPRIAVFTNAVDQSVWSLRNLGFTADPVGTTALNGASDPLVSYDAVFSTANYPANTAGNALRGRGWRRSSRAAAISAAAAAARFITNGGLATGLTTGTRSGSGRSGIVFWDNTGGPRAIRASTRPGTRPSSIRRPGSRLFRPAGRSTPTCRSRASSPRGSWLIDAASASAPRAPMIAHGTSTTAGAPRLAAFAFNPLYRADPEREWPALGSAAYWVDAG